MCLLADQYEKIYLKHFKLSANDKICLLKVYYLLNKAHEFIRTFMEMVSEMMKKLMKTVGVFDIFSLKTVSAFKREMLFLKKTKDMFTWAFSSTYNCWVVPELLCLKSFWRLGRADQWLLRSDHNGQYGKKIMSQTHPCHQTTVYLWEGKQEGTNHYPLSENSANVKSVSAIKKASFGEQKTFHICIHSFPLFLLSEVPLVLCLNSKLPKLHA